MLKSTNRLVSTLVVILASNVFTAKAQLGPPRAEFFRPAPALENLHAEDEVFPRGRLFPFSFFSTGGGDAANEEAFAEEVTRLKALGVPLIGPQYEFNERAPADARSHGMKTIYAVGITRPQLLEEHMPLAEAIARLREQVTAVAQDDSIAWWYLQPEELRYWRPEELEYLAAAVKTIRDADPLHRPIWLYEPGHRTGRQMAPIARYLDIVGKGMYTNYSSMKKSRVWCRWTIEQELEAIAETNPNAIPIAVPEMFQQPTEEELPLIPTWVRHDAYLALITGAKGIVVFSARARDNFPSRKQYLEAWEQVAKELCGPKGLGQVFLFGEPRKGLEIDIIDGPDRVTTRRLSRIEKEFEYPSIAFLDVAHGSARYLFAVNSANEPVKAVIGGLPYGDTRVENLFEGTPAYVVAEGDVEVEFGPLEVKAFRITGPVAKPADLTPQQKLSQRGFRVSPDDLMRVARSGDVETLALLRDAGLDINVRCAGTTALMWAAGAGHREAVAWLIENGAELQVADPDFWTALLWAENSKHDEVAEALRKAGLTESRIFE